MSEQAKVGWREVDEAAPERARAVLARACGSSRWVERMLARRPFRSHARLLAAARVEWFGLTERDWLEAFSHHPRIGDRTSLEKRFAATHDLSAKEQSGVSLAGADVIGALAQANDDYFNRFGFIFIVCATGKTAAEMLALLLDRMRNDRATELRVAAEEQAKITALRLS